MLDALAGLRGHYDVAAERRLVDAFALNPDKRIRAYSKGNRQKVLLVAAFAARTELLVLDEPTSGLDPLMEEVFQHCVREASGQGRTVLLSSHILSEVEKVCTDVTILKDGRLVENGALRDLRHLAGSRVTATVPIEAVGSLRSAVADLVSDAPGAAVTEDGGVDAAVAAADVPVVLQRLLDVGAQGIACTPATLDDLFLRHYAGAAR